VETALAYWAAFKAEQGFGPREKRKRKSLLDFQIPFAISNLFSSKSNSNLHTVPTHKIKYESTH
jgi:hypothetical protein